MSDKKIIAVVGATGAQGGGLVRAILADPDGGFAARAITRNPDSEKARALAAAGAEVVAADVDDAASLKAALAGCHGAYFVTFFWEHFSPDIELAQATNMATAASENGLRHVIWSTLEDTRKWIPLDDDRMPTLAGEYKVPHFDSKGQADAVFTAAGVPTTFLLTSFYWDNLINFGMAPQRNEEGNLVFALPMGDARLSGIAAEDIGGAAYGIFKAGDRYIGKTVGIAGGHLTGEDMAASLGRIFDEDVSYFAVPFDMYRGFGFDGAEDLGNMFQFKHDFNEYYTGIRNLDETRSLNPSLQSFDGWLQANRDRIPKS